MKDFCAERSHLQHFIVSYLFHLARIRYNPRICGVDAVYIRVDFTDIRVQLCSEGNRSRIGAAASERCDIIVFVDPLEDQSVVRAAATFAVPPVGLNRIS